MRIYRRGRVYWCTYHDARAGRTVRATTHCTDRAAALVAAQLLQRAGADPDRAEAEGATIGEALKDLLKEQEAEVKDGRLKQATADFYRKRARQIGRMVVEGILPGRLAHLQAKHVDALIEQRRSEGVKRPTIAKDLIVLRLALKLAKRRGRWRGDIDEVLPHRFGGSSEGVTRWLTHAELYALLGALRLDRAAWVCFAIATGANLSETQKATPADVRSDWVHVRGTKTAKRDRRVPLGREWQTRLMGLAINALDEHNHYPFHNVKDPLFDSWTKVVRDLHLACEKAGIPPVSTNDLRRTYATWMYADGVPVSVIARSMGHADSRMLEKHYAHVTPEQLAKLVRGEK